MDIDARIPILPKQQLFLSSKTRGAIFWAGIGGGKTRVMCLAAVRDALMGIRAQIVSFTYRNLLDAVWPTLTERQWLNNEEFIPSALESYGMVYEKDYTLNRSDFIINLRGTQILLRSGDDPQKLRGPNLGSFYIDEAREFPDRAVFDIMLGRIRQREDAHWAIGSSAKGKFWLWHLIRELGLEEGLTTGFAVNDDCTLCVQSTIENTFLPEKFLIDIQKRYTGKFAAQELEGKVVEFSAGVYMREWFSPDRRCDPWKPVEGVRYWDLAASINSWSDWSVGLLMAKKDGITMVCDVVRAKTLNLQDLIVETALADGPGVIVAIESIRMQAAITGSIQGDARLANFKVVADKIVGDKYNRALPNVGKFEAGIIRICRGTWNDTYVDEMCSFTPEETSDHDDQVDATSGAWKILNMQPVINKASPALAPSVVDQQRMKLYGVMEMKDFKAHCIKCWYNSYADWLEIDSELCTNRINEIVAFMHPCQFKIGGEDLEGPSLKSLSQAMMRKDCAIWIEKLDEGGAVEATNSMILRHALYTKPGLRTWTELMSADKDNFSPWVTGMLRIIQHTYMNKPAPPPEPLAPFEKKRREFRAKLDAGKVATKKGWIN